jgi:hypothetical protein
MLFHAGFILSMSSSLYALEGPQQSIPLELQNSIVAIKISSTEILSTPDQGLGDQELGHELDNAQQMILHHDHYCTATVIAPLTILTAAHCLNDYTSNDEVWIQQEKVKNVKVSRLDLSSNQVDFDLAVLQFQLSKKSQLQLQPIRLVSEGLNLDSNVWLAGFGDSFETLDQPVSSVSPESMTHLMGRWGQNQLESQSAQFETILIESELQSMTLFEKNQILNLKSWASNIQLHETRVPQNEVIALNGDSGGPLLSLFNTANVSSDQHKMEWIQRGVLLSYESSPRAGQAILSIESAKGHFDFPIKVYVLDSNFQLKFNEVELRDRLVASQLIDPMTFNVLNHFEIKIKLPSITSNQIANLSNPEVAKWISKFIQPQASYSTYKF